MSRPSLNRVRLIVRVLPETAKALREQATGKPLGYAVDELIGCQPVRQAKPPRAAPVPMKAHPLLPSLKPAPNPESEAEILARLNASKLRV